MTWLPEAFTHSQRVDLPTGHHLRPIREAGVDIDYPAVTASREWLWEKYGAAWGWPPADMSYEADREDLARHEEEIARARDVQLRNPGRWGVYVDPPDEQSPPDSEAVVSWWVVHRATGSELERTLATFVPGWLSDSWGFESIHYAP
jgi:hypothetical protein